MELSVSNASSWDYQNLHRAVEGRFPPGGKVKGRNQSIRWCCSRFRLSSHYYFLRRLWILQYPASDYRSMSFIHGVQYSNLKRTCCSCFSAVAVCFSCRCASEAFRNGECSIPVQILVKLLRIAEKEFSRVQHERPGVACMRRDNSLCCVFHFDHLLYANRAAGVYRRRYHVWACESGYAVVGPTRG